MQPRDDTMKKTPEDTEAEAVRRLAEERLKLLRSTYFPGEGRDPRERRPLPPGEAAGMVDDWVHGRFA